MSVSIHTPTWGVTIFCNLLLLHLPRFNPHTYMRCDISHALAFPHTIMFQSTHLHEVWRLRALCESIHWCFNPHTYMRCDTVSLMTEVLIHCFNPHTYMRCDLSNITSKSFPWVSIHTPTWGVTSHVIFALSSFSVSIHTPTWGVTLLHSCSWCMHLGFNPHTYMRCDTFSGLSRMFRLRFNPHTYMRCDSAYLV